MYYKISWDEPVNRSVKNNTYIRYIETLSIVFANGAVLH